MTQKFILQERSGFQFALSVLNSLIKIKIIFKNILYLAKNG